MRAGWHVIAGYGSHIKATSRSLIIHRKGHESILLFRDLHHLLILGGHTIQTTAISSLIESGISITFFKSDGTPIAMVRPPHHPVDRNLQEYQKTTPPFTNAVIIAKQITKNRILAIEKWDNLIEGSLLYSGELDILHQSLHEISFLITMDEIRRIERLVTDMYYEVLVRYINMTRYQQDETFEPVLKELIHTILGFGYAILTGLCNVNLIGAFLDPDISILSKGRWGLAQDFANLNKTAMIDSFLIPLIISGIEPHGYEMSKNRCILSEHLIKKILTIVYHSINQSVIVSQIEGFIASLEGDKEWILSGPL